MLQMKSIVLTGGGTAGHVTPNLALIPPLAKDGWTIHYIGTESGIERDLLKDLPAVVYHGIKSGKLRRYFDLKNLTDPFRVLYGVGQAMRLIARIKPDVVFSKGGFVSVPVVYGAFMNRVPVILHESDMTPGLANRLSMPLASKLLCSFPESAQLAGRKGVYVGTPIRPEILRGRREEGLKLFRFNANRPVLMVMGGSTGAQAINAALREALPALLDSFQVLHLCGKGNLDDGFYCTPGYTQVEYLTDEMADAYATAEIIVSRAGSNSLCEILALHKPALLIPYPATASRGDQIENAKSFEKQGFSRVLDQADMTAKTLEKNIVALYKDRGALIECMETSSAANGLKNTLDILSPFGK
jgi:UDP-N-acetylglucosamine--N-acetylmuramyl-(pentapeptide) pyrophosphoryl-undecaprenol N-acetylglucosamine transferase